jgi:hypothetical protein
VFGKELFGVGLDDRAARTSLEQRLGNANALGDTPTGFGSTGFQAVARDDGFVLFGARATNFPEQMTSFAVAETQDCPASENLAGQVLKSSLCRWLLPVFVLALEIAELADSLGRVIGNILSAILAGRLYSRSRPSRSLANGFAAFDRAVFCSRMVVNLWREWSFAMETELGRASLSHNRTPLLLVVADVNQ